MSSDSEAAQAVRVSENISPEAVKKRFRGYKRLLIKLVGRGPMDDKKIDEIGKAEFGRRWAADEASQILRMRVRFAIVNTATSRHDIGRCGRATSGLHVRLIWPQYRSRDLEAKPSCHRG